MEPHFSCRPNCNTFRFLSRLRFPSKCYISASSIDKSEYSDSVEGVLELFMSFEINCRNISFTFNVLLTVHLSITLVNTNLKNNYFILYYVYYSPLHASSNIVLIIRRSNCTNTESGIVTLCKWPPVHRLRHNSLNL